jgi:serine/threonine protein kinase
VVALLVAVARRVHADYHARALVHADIKPSNVLIRTDGGVALIDAVNPALRRPYSHGSPAGPGQLCRACIFPARLAAPLTQGPFYTSAAQQGNALSESCSDYKRLQRSDL